MANKKTVVIDGITYYADQPGRRVIIDEPNKTPERMRVAIHMLAMHNRKARAGKIGNRGVRVGGSEVPAASLTESMARWFKRWGLVQDVAGQPGWIELTHAGMTFAISCMDKIPKLEEFTPFPEDCYLPRDHPACN